MTMKQSLRAASVTASAVALAAWYQFAEPRRIFIQWHANGNDPGTVYNIWMGTNEGTYPMLIAHTTNTNCYFKIVKGGVFYFIATAIDINGNDSPPSNVAIFTNQ